MGKRNSAVLAVLRAHVPSEPHTSRALPYHTHATASECATACRRGAYCASKTVRWRTLVRLLLLLLQELLLPVGELGALPRGRDAWRADAVRWAGGPRRHERACWVRAGT